MAMMGEMTSTRTAGLETDRLRLDPLRRSDATEMVCVLGSPELYRYTGAFSIIATVALTATS